MGIFTYDIVLLDILFLKKLRARNDILKFRQKNPSQKNLNKKFCLKKHLKFPRPLTQLKSFWRGQRPRWHSNIVDFLGEYEAMCKTALAQSGS
jgi:hypothetical protein